MEWKSSFSFEQKKTHPTLTHAVYPHPHPHPHIHKLCMGDADIKTHNKSNKLNEIQLAVNPMRKKKKKR